jgi:hypothetical protein
LIKLFFLIFFSASRDVAWRHVQDSVSKIENWRAAEYVPSDFDAFRDSVVVTDYSAGRQQMKVRWLLPVRSLSYPVEVF